MIVVKYGGAALADPAARAAFADDVRALRAGGERVVVVHGGGPLITARLAAAGVPTTFVQGLRVTTPEVMEVVVAALAEANADVVALLGADAVGVPGERVFTAIPRDPALGLVGEVTTVETSALPADRVPVVSSVARGVDGLRYNVNADTAAAALAVALGAAEAVFLTDVDGLYADYPRPDSLVERVTAAELHALLPTLADGMAPKMEGCLRAVRGGVAAARVARTLRGARGTTVTA